MAGPVAADSGRNIEEGCVASSVESWGGIGPGPARYWLALVTVGGCLDDCCLGSCLPVARRKVVLLRSGPGLDALGVQVVALASQLSALLVPASCGLLGCIALA